MSNIFFQDDLPTSPNDLLAYLDTLGIVATTSEHEPLFTVADSKRITRTQGGNTKNLFVKDKSSNYFLLTAEQSAQVDLKNLHKLIGGKGRLSFGSEEKMMELLGVRPGSVTTFGLINDTKCQVKFVLDKTLTTCETINCHPLVNTATTNIKYNDFIRFVESTKHDILIIDLTTQHE